MCRGMWFSARAPLTILPTIGYRELCRLIASENRKGAMRGTGP